MSNIHTLGSIQRPLNSGGNFHGTARTLNGDVIRTEPTTTPLPEPPRRYQPTDDSPYETHEIIIDPTTAIPAELKTTFWSQNAPPQSPGQFSCKRFCLDSFCPCCVGPTCSEVRKKDWKRAMKTVTFWLIVVEVILYLAMVVCTKTGFDWTLSPSVDVCLMFGANCRCKVQYQYHYHRLLSYILLHGSWIHILSNTFFQFSMALACEAAWGTWKFLIIFIVTGFIGGLTSDLAQSAISVGASCALFGVLGCYITLIGLYWSRMEAMVKRVMVIMLIMIPAMFLILSFLPRVDWRGHLGGLLSGMSTGAIVFANRASTRKGKIISAVAGTICTALLLIIQLLIINFVDIKSFCEMNHFLS